MTHTQTSFRNLGIEPNLLTMIDALKFTTPTPIQHKVIPVAIEGKDIIGIAQTGTGKTALQVNDALQKITSAYKMRTTVVIGGASMHEQILRLRQNPHIIIATPGRLNDHIEHQRLRLDNVSVLVLDEADRMLDMGFLPQIERIIRIIPRQRQTMLFSATIPPTIVKIASRHMQLPVQTEIAPSGTAAELVSQEMFIVRHEMKGNLLNELLKQYNGAVRRGNSCRPFPGPEKRRLKRL
jgi:superfamily II DNA/RNA helicase